MFQYLYQWMENLAVYMILITTVLQMLPENSYQKYIRFFTGLLLVVMLAAPVLHLFGMQEQLAAACERELAGQERRMEEKIQKYMEEFQEREEASDASEMDPRS